MRSHPSYNDQYLETLAVAGEDGTVSKRFRDSDLKGRAFLKTGTLNGVSSLSGYVLLPAGDDLIFAIIINGTGLNAWKAHEFQETLLDSLVHLNGVNSTSAVNAY
ncbi:MAG: D-alanyl-D-alanine carboxypeptidase/D-alanyl-D-alanine-endopeptidase [uncultured bacterium]|nr:MAG: D-alanyl-D-alanine carboxypeptidase/D-alanyl-D-alanine-endopeptidase [uncultured bacterium]